LGVFLKKVNQKKKESRERKSKKEDIDISSKSKMWEKHQVIYSG
jgi:hypothetical protein